VAAAAWTPGFAGEFWRELVEGAGVEGLAGTVAWRVGSSVTPAVGCVVGSSVDTAVGGIVGGSVGTVGSRVGSSVGPGTSCVAGTVACSDAVSVGAGMLAGTASVATGVPLSKTAVRSVWLAI